ncbi:hypothetical protein LZF95_20075 [Algoriphagus sp. AGSA1]|uniref:hypothetical protein n=1 Tax=Algoriphagus sp. AGSA1 TaxID=2907213 RepID=UPI001F243A29|nr:hypothetical protein [Algoriphagus sp. AGSA1]MCE7056988.1 hypothetical protein [Algoriphagus sp. AGSA1]
MVRNFITLITLAVFVWLVWSFSGRNTPLKSPDGYISVVEEINLADTLSRNILGVQPYMEVSDYFNQAVFKEKLKKYIIASSAKGLIRKNTLIVYPESIGTWLFLINEKHNLAEKKQLHKVLRAIAFSNAFDFLLGYIKTGDESNKEFSSIIRMKAKSMAKAYFETFGELAIETNSYLLAGSIVLPGPKVMNGEIYVDLNGSLRNASFLFGPDGKVVGDPIFKTFPHSAESTYFSFPDSADSQVFNLPFAKTAVILGYDSWFDQAYESAKSNDAEVIINPSFLSGNHSLLSKWQDFDGIHEPKNLDPADAGVLTIKDAWEKYSLPTQLKDMKSKVGLTVFFNGNLWDMGKGGHPIVVYNDEILPSIPAGKGGIWSLNY